MNGEELGDKELQQFSVVLKRRNKTIKVHPFQIADTDDSDNNIDLCIKEKGIPISVSVKANTAIDPRDDANELSQIKIVSRW